MLCQKRIMDINNYAGRSSKGVGGGRFEGKETMVWKTSKNTAIWQELWKRKGNSEKGKHCWRRTEEFLW